MHFLENLYAQHFNALPEKIIPLKGDASDRRIFRLISGDRSVIGIRSDSRAENEAFIGFSRHFRNYGLPIPEIYAVDMEHGAYIEEDLGDKTLFQWAQEQNSGEGYSNRTIEMYKKVIEILPVFQITAGQSINFDLCYQHKEFAEETIMWDLHYFRDRFLKLFYLGELNERALQSDFSTLMFILLEEPRDYFMYRDFQSRNIMIKNNSPHFIDYQSGRKGALQYDIAALLYDAKAAIPNIIRDELLTHYLEQVQNIIDIDEKRFRYYYRSFVLIRIMQALGAYGFIGKVKGKKDFLRSIPFAMQNLEYLLNEENDVLKRLPTLRSVFLNLVQQENLRDFDDA